MLNLSVRRRVVKLLAGAVIVAGTIGGTSVLDVRATAMAAPSGTAFGVVSTHHSSGSRHVTRVVASSHHTMTRRTRAPVTSAKLKHNVATSKKHTGSVTSASAGYGADAGFASMPPLGATSPHATPFALASGKHSNGSSHTTFVVFIAIAIAIAVVAVGLVSSDVRKQLGSARSRRAFRGVVAKPSRTMTTKRH